MPIAFLAPVFLAGLAALAIPVLIHLSNRPKKETIAFPSLMFLERVEYQSDNRRWLRNLVLFTLRSLALILVAAAFARPFLDRADAGLTAPEGGREVVVLLDRSGSMAVGDRMERAREAVAGVAGGLRRGDRATVIAFSGDAAAANRATDQPAVLRSAADTVRPGAGPTRYAPALRLAESILTGTPLPRRELVLVTDFQRNAFDAADAPRMPAGTVVRAIAVGEPVSNTFVASASFRRERFAGRDRVAVSATVASRGAESAVTGDAAPAGGGLAEGGREVQVELVADGRVLDRQAVRLSDDGAASVRFEPVTLGDAPLRGAVRTAGDAMPADDALHFVLSPSRALRILLLGGAGERPFLERALGVGAVHEVARVPAGRLTPESLAGVDVVVLDDEPPADGLARLEGWVQAGGGLVVPLGASSRARSWGDVGLFPGSFGATRDAGAAGVSLARIQGEHPVFEPFRASSSGLSAARFYRYREVSPESEAEVLARFGDGAPAIVAAEVGQGRVVVLASSFDGEWNDLVLQPAFVPLVHRLVRFASGREPAPEWRTVGDLLDAGPILAAGGDPAGDRGAEPVLLTPSDRAIAVRGGALHRFQETGFYELRDPATGMGEVIAVNADRSESEPGTVDPDEVVAAVEGAPTGPATASFAPEDRERRQSLWWYFLAAAFVMMALETLLSNVLSRRPLPRVEEAR
jgi:hypothetical protein